MSLNLAIAASRRRNGWCVVSALLLSQRPHARRSLIPMTLSATPHEPSRSVPDRSRSAVTLPCALQDLQRGPAIPALGRENLKHLAFVIHRVPQVVRLAVDPDEHFIQMPSPLVMTSMLLNAPLPDLRGEHRTKPVPPNPHGAQQCATRRSRYRSALEQQFFYLSQGQRITDVHHHREADHLGRNVEIAKRITHRRRLRNAPPRLKPIYSDNACTPIPCGTTNTRKVPHSADRDRKGQAASL